MKKRIFRIVCLLALAVAVVGVTAACGNRKKAPAHVHAFETVVIREATCTQEGATVQRCTVCGFEGETIYVPTVAHTPTAWVHKTEPTCEHEGLAESVCTECGRTFTEVLEKTEHVYDDWRVNRPASCSAEGEEIRNCRTCGAADTRVIQKRDHTPETVDEQPANCLEAGVAGGVRCSVCGETLSGLTVIPALGHRFGAWDETKASTCTEHGKRSHECERCHTVEEDKEMPLLPHTPEPIEAIDPTCETAGRTAGSICSVCRTVLVEPTERAALGHKLGTATHYEQNGIDRHKAQCERCSYAEDAPCAFELTQSSPATCIRAAHHVHVCPVCAYSYEHDDPTQPATGHRYETFGDSVWKFDTDAYLESLDTGAVVRRHIRICTNPNHEAGEEDPDVLPCADYAEATVEPTCYAKGYTEHTCRDCGDVYRDATVAEEPHALSQWAQYEIAPGVYAHRRACQNENCVYEENEFCNYTAPGGVDRTSRTTCEQDGVRHRVCAVCLGSPPDVVVRKAYGHVYEGWTHVAGTEGDGASLHERYCTRCGEGRQEALCTFESADRVPTCGEAGREIDICKDCRYTIDGNEIPALEHDYADAVYTPDGRHSQHYRVCNRCRSIEYTDCAYTYTYTPATCTADGIRKGSCQLCGDSYEAIYENASGHSYVYRDAGETHLVECSVCGDATSEAHDFSLTNVCPLCRRDGLTYKLLAGGGEACVSGDSVNGKSQTHLPSKEYLIADFYLGVPVTQINGMSFQNNKTLESVTIPRSVRIIQYNAFYGCASLRQVRIEGHAYGEANIDDSALETIDTCAFQSCTKLAHAVLPLSLRTIKSSAFRDCVNLHELVVPDSVDEIGPYAFSNTGYYNAASNWVDGVLYIDRHLIKARTNIASDYTVQKKTVSVGMDAFADCAGLTRIVLPETLRVVATNAFKNCTALDEVVFEGTFEQYLLIRFDNDYASPMRYARTLTITGATGRIEIPESVTAIPAGAFRNASITEVTIHASVTSIGEEAFFGCSALASIVIDDGSRLSYIGADAFEGTAFCADPANWTNGILYLRCPEGHPVALIESRDEDLADDVTIDEMTRVVAAKAFYGSNKLRRIVIPDSVLFLGAQLFEECSALQQVDFLGTGASWWANTLSGMARMYSDEYMSTRNSPGNDTAAVERDNRGMFRLYNGEWRRSGKV